MGTDGSIRLVAPVIDASTLTLVSASTVLQRIVIAADPVAVNRLGNLITVQSGDDMTVHRPSPLVVNIVEELGSDAFVYASLTNEFGHAEAVHSGAGDAQMIVRVDPRQVPDKGETIWVAIRQGQQHLFHAGSGERFN